MANVLFESGDHRCVVFNDLVRSDDGVQANQFLVMHNGASALIDPGGALLYTPLSMAMSKYVQPKDLTWLLASHQDPDIIGAADRWLMYTQATVVCSKLWGRFVPHTVPHYQQNAGQERYMLLPDEGGRIPMGDSYLVALPAHFLHSVGNFSFYDPVSRILFSGDVGASMVEWRTIRISRTRRACPKMVPPPLHGLNKVAKPGDMVRAIDPDIVPPARPADAIRSKTNLTGCQAGGGIDLLGPANYRSLV